LDKSDFRRYLTKEPIFIPFEAILEIKLGKWHSGRWALGRPIVKIVWRKGDVKLSSGFIVSRHKEDASRIKSVLDARIRPS
jgi:hypothetical protein